MYLECSQWINAPPVTEKEQGVVGVHHHQVQQRIVVSGVHAPDTLTAPVLNLVGVAGYSLDVAALTQGHHHVLMGDELLGGLVLDFFFIDDCPPGIAEVLLQLAGLGLDRGQDLGGTGQ